MKVHLTFKQQNPNFDKEHAKQYHSGEESNENMKDKWSLSFEVNCDVNEIAIIENGNYKLKGTLDNGSKVDLKVPKMKILKCLDLNGQELVSYAVSNELVKKTHKAYNKKYNTTRYYFYFENRDDFVEVRTGLYIIAKDIPHELLK